MTKIEKLPVFGYKGNSYFFTVYPLQAQYPGDAGIYIFAKRVPAPNPVYTIVFIGEVPSLANITVDHRHTWLENNGVNTVCVLPVEKQEDRLNIVEELIDRYKPECNVAANG